MTTSENKKAHATLTARKALKEMIVEGLGETKYIFALSNALMQAFSLTRDEALEVLEIASQNI